MTGLIASADDVTGSTVTSHVMIRKILLACGILSSLLYVGATFLAAMVWQGYDSILQPVSELGAIDAPSQPVMLLLGTIYDLLVIAFGIGAWKSADGKRTLRIVAGLLLGYGVACLMAPLTPIHVRGVTWTLTDTLHLVFAGVDVLFIVLILVFGANAFGRGFRLYSIGTILLGAVAGVLMGLDAPHFGFWERINIFSFMLWIVVFAVALWRSQNGQAKIPEALPELTRGLSASH
jgi:Protein of unknown function (DUF998)